jgi:hypothetical protein
MVHLENNGYIQNACIGMETPSATGRRNKKTYDWFVDNIKNVKKINTIINK